MNPHRQVVKIIFIFYLNAALKIKTLLLNSLSRQKNEILQFKARLQVAGVRLFVFYLLKTGQLIAECRLNYRHNVYFCFFKQAHLDANTASAGVLGPVL